MACKHAYRAMLSAISEGIFTLAKGWTVLGSNPGGDEIFRTRPDRPWAQASYTMGTGSHSRGQCGRAVD
jgi:hypothetical protein